MQQGERDGKRLGAVFLLKPLLTITCLSFDRSFGKVWKTIGVFVWESGFSKNSGWEDVTPKVWKEGKRGTIGREGKGGGEVEG